VKKLEQKAEDEYGPDEDQLPGDSKA